MEVAEPLAIRHITLTTREIFHVASVDKDDVKAPAFEDFEDRNPVDPGSFHRDVGDATRGEPRRQPVQIAREGREGPYRRRVAIGGHRDEVGGRAAINPGGVWMETCEDCR